VIQDEAKHSFEESDSETNPNHEKNGKRIAINQ